MSEQCSVRVSDTWGVGFHACGHKAVTVEDGKPVCGTHTKAAKERRDAKGSETYNAYLRRANAPYDRIKTLKDTNTKLLAALEDCSERMERARRILIGSNPKASWGMLDTKKAREAIQEATLDVQKAANQPQR